MEVKSLEFGKKWSRKTKREKSGRAGGDGLQTGRTGRDRMSIYGKKVDEVSIEGEIENYELY